jgi:hypothetical protein
VENSCEYGNETLGSIKGGGIFWPAEIPKKISCNRTLDHINVFDHRKSMIQLGGKYCTRF